MKLFSIVFFLSTNVFACPQISGSYTCNYEDGPETIEINQTNSGGIEVYNIDGTDFSADGVTKNYSDEAFVGKITTSCSSSSLNISTIGDIFENGAKTSYVAVTESYYMTNDGLVSSMIGNFEYQGQVYPVDDKVLCTKN